MRNLVVLVLLAGLLPAKLTAQPGDVFLLGEGRGNVMQRWAVAREKWRTQPKWAPSSAGALPLSVAKAVEIGESWLRKHHTDITKLAVSQVMLRMQSSAGPGVDDGWFYRVEFQPIVAGKRVWGADLVAVVLFDGTVVVPKAEPYTAPRN